MAPISTLLKGQIQNLALYMPKFVLLSDYANLGNLLTDFANSLLLAAGDDKDWQTSVKDKDLVAPPAGPYTVGDRYLIAGVGGAWSAFAINDIVEWDGSVWMDFKPNDGFTVFIEDEEKWYFYNGTSWAIRPPLDWDRTGTTLSPSIAGDDVDMGVGGMIKVDNITESTAGAGATIETVLLKDNEVIANKLTSKSHPVYDVTQWGLKADGGTTNNSPLLAALIDQVILDGGGTIYFPNTDSWYQFESAVVKTLNDGALDVAITFLGEPSRQGNHEVALIWNAGVNGLQLARGTVEFKNISIYGPAAIPDFSAIYLTTSVFSSFEKVYIQDAYNGIKIQGSLICSFKQVQCSNIPTGGRGIWLYQTQDIAIDLCNFPGAYVGIDIDSNSYPNNISIRNCRFADGGSYGLYIHKAQNVYCENLTFGSTWVASEGIRLDTCSNVILDGIYFEELPTATWDIFIENNPQNVTLRNYKSVKPGYTGINDTSRMTIIGGEYDTPTQLPYVKGIVNRGADIISGVAGVKAIGKLVFTGDSIATETLTINGQVHTFVNAIPTAANEIRAGIGADLASGRAVRYFNELSSQKDKIVATWDLVDTVYFYAKVPGVTANAYTFTETCTNASIPAATGFMNNQQVGVDPIDTFSVDDVTGNITTIGNVDGVDVSTLPGAISAKVAKAGDTMTGDLIMDNQKSISFRELTANGVNYAKIQAPAILGADYTLTLPVDDGTPNQLLMTDGSGVLSWADVIQYWARAGTILSPTTAGDDVALDTGDLSATEIQSKISPVYNVKLWGLKGDGATDDGPAFRTLLAAVITANGGTIYFPKATYKMTGENDFTNTPNIHILGDGVDETIIDWSSDTTATHTQFKNIGNWSSLRNFTAINGTNYTYQNLAFTFSGSDGVIENVKVSAGLYGTVLEGNRIKVKNLTHIGELYQFRINGTDCIVEGSYFQNNNTGPTCYVINDRNIFIKCYFTGAGDNVDLYSPATFINCYFDSAIYDLSNLGAENTTLIQFRSSAGNYSKLNDITKFDIIGSSATYYSRLSNVKTINDGTASYVYKRIKITKTFTDFSIAAFTKTINIFSLPAGAAIKDIYANVTAAFTNPAIDEVLTVDGTVQGTAVVADTTGFVVGNYIAIDNTPAAAEIYGYITAIADGVWAVGSLTALAGAVLTDGDTFTISDGVVPVTFEFDLGGGVTPGNIAVPILIGDTNAQVAAKMIVAINGTAIGVTATSGGGALVNLINDLVGVVGNVVITEVIFAGTLTPIGMAGGLDASGGYYGIRMETTPGGGTAVDLSLYLVISTAHVYYDLSADVIEIGNAGDTSKYIIAGRDVFTAPIFVGLAADKDLILSDGTTNIENFGGATNIVCKMDSTGALLNQLTVGSIDFYIEYSDKE